MGTSVSFSFAALVGIRTLSTIDIVALPPSLAASIDCKRARRTASLFRNFPFYYSTDRDYRTAQRRTSKRDGRDGTRRRQRTHRRTLCTQRRGCCGPPSGLSMHASSRAAALASTAAAILPGSHVAHPETSALPCDRSTSSAGHEDASKSTYNAHTTLMASHHASPSGSSASPAVGTTATKANGSAASDTAVPAVGASTSASSTTTYGSLKRPFSRVDELLEAAASPSSDSTSSQLNKQVKMKKLPKSNTSDTKDSRSSILYNSAPASTSTASLSSNSNGITGESTTGTTTPTTAPATRKSAYQGPKISMACYSCRSSKTRCSGTQPCNRCDLKKMQCSYPLRDGRTANRTSLHTLGASSPLSSSANNTPPYPTHQNGYEPGPMQRFNQAFALKSNSHRALSHTAPGAGHAMPSVFQHQAPPSSATSTRDSPPSHSHSFPRPPSSALQSQQRQDGTSTNGENDRHSSKRPSTGSSTTSRTHMTLPLGGNGSTGKSSISPEYHSPRLSSSYPRFHHQDHHNGQEDHGRPATAGASQYTSTSARIKMEEGHRHSRDRSRSYPHPVPSYLKDYTLPLPSLRNTPLASPVIGSESGSEYQGPGPEKFLEGSSSITEKNALQLKDHRRPVNAHPESNAFSESDPIYKQSPTALQSQQGSGLPYPASSAYLPFSLQQHRYSPLFSSSSSSFSLQHHLRGEDAYNSHATVVKREAESSPRIDELSGSPGDATPFEHNQSRTDEELYNSEANRSRTSPPSIASTAATSLTSSLYGEGNKAGTYAVGPAYSHTNSLLPSILGSNRALPDALIPWKGLLQQAGIPDLETLKSEIPFEAVKRYVDCLAESWPDVLPTFTKRFQLRYAIEDALTRACRDVTSKVSDY